MTGWDKLPDPPALLIGIHSGAPLPWDAWTVGIQWWRRHGRKRPLHGTRARRADGVSRARSLLPEDGASCPRRPTASPRRSPPAATWRCGRAATATRCVRGPRRDDALLAGRTGFIKLAIRTGVPIVPISTVGGPDSMPVLATGKRFAKLLALDRVARLKMFPIALQLPWGSPPRCCPRSRCRPRSGRRSRIRSGSTQTPERADDGRYVRDAYREVQRVHPGWDGRARSAAATAAVRLGATPGLWR